MSAPALAVASPPAAGRPAHLVFGRGGIRGIAMAGAATALCRAGYRVERVSGISVGGIVAALLASGHSPEEVREVAWELDYASFRDGGRAPGVPVLGPLWRLLTRLGCYEGDTLQRTLAEVLARKGVRTFRDLRAEDAGDLDCPYRLQVLCADVTRGRLVVLPEDARLYGLDPDALEVALALRMTASLPFFFRPVRLGPPASASLVLDGGLVAGIPYRLFAAARSERWETIGIQAGPAPARRPSVIRGPLSLLRAAYYTALRANQETQDQGCATGTIDIDCGATSAIDFGLSDPRKQALFDSGSHAARRFILEQAPPAAHLSIAGG